MWAVTGWQWRFVVVTAILGGVCCGRSNMLDTSTDAAGGAAAVPGAPTADGGGPGAGGARAASGGSTVLPGSGGGAGKDSGNGGTGGVGGNGGASGSGGTGDTLLDAGQIREAGAPMPPDAASDAAPGIDAAASDAGSLKRVGYPEDAGHDGRYDLGTLLAYRVFVAEDTTLAGFGVILRAGTTTMNGDQIAFALYEDRAQASGPTPGALLARTGIVPTGTAPRRLEVPPVAPLTLSGNHFYWIAFEMSGERLIGLRVETSTLSFRPHVFGALPDPFDDGATPTHTTSSLTANVYLLIAP